MMRLTNLNRGGGETRPLINLDDRFILAVLVFVCLCSGWGRNIYQTEAFILVIVAFAALALSIGDIVVGTIGVYMAIGYMALYTMQAVGISKVEPAVIASSLHIMTASLIVYIVVRFGKTVKEKYLSVICLISCFLSVLGIFGYLTERLAVATLGNQNFLGAFLSIGALACFDRRRWPGLLIILPGLWCTNTATAIAAFLAGLGYLAWRWKGVALCALPGAAYIHFVKGGYGSLVTRASYWQDALERMSSSWHTLLFGMGPGIPWLPDYSNTLHSAYAYIVWNLGFIGLAVVGLYIFRSFTISRDERIVAMMISVCVDGIANYITGTVPTATLAATVFAMNDRNLFTEKKCPAQQ